MWNRKDRAPKTFTRTKMKILLPLLLLSASTFAQPSVAAGNPGPDENYIACFHRADDEMGKFQFNESIKSCEEALKYKPDDFLVRAMECLDYYEIAEKLDVKKPDEKQWKIDAYNKMIDIANDGIKCAPDKGECYFMRGLANARLATTKGIFSQLFFRERDRAGLAHCRQPQVRLHHAARRKPAGFFLPGAWRLLQALPEVLPVEMDVRHPGRPGEGGVVLPARVRARLNAHRNREGTRRCPHHPRAG